MVWLALRLRADTQRTRARCRPPAGWRQRPGGHGSGHAMRRPAAFGRRCAAAGRRRRPPGSV